MYYVLLDHYLVSPHWNRNNLSAFSFFCHGYHYDISDITVPKLELKTKEKKSLSGGNSQ